MKGRRPGLYARFLPFLRWLPHVDRGTLRIDFMAGLTGAVIVLPQGVAFATIAGLPPEYGLYAAMVPAVVAALFGSSRHLVSGPTTAVSVVLFSSLSALAEPGTAEYVTLALTLTFMVGAMELALGLARMGAVVNFISHSVIVGFTAGAAILIAGKQLPNFFGVQPAPGGYLDDILYQFARQIPDINGHVTAVALVTLFSGLAVKRWLPGFPYLIAAMLAGGLAALGLNAAFGPEATAIGVVGRLPRSLPPLSMPDFSLETIKHLATPALAMTLLALTEAVSIGRSLGLRSGQRIDGNQEFIGQGLSNIAGSFFSGYVATGSLNRSALNYQAGARTPLAAAFSGLLLVVIVVLVAPLAAYLPNAAMAGLLFLVAWGVIDFREIRHILKSSRRETAIMTVTFLGALFLELEVAIFAGVILSLVLYLEKVAHPNIVRRVPDPGTPRRKFSSDPALPECPQLKFLRIDGSLFFGSVNHIEEAFARIEAENPGQKHLAIVAQGINFADIAGGNALVKEARRRKMRGGGLYLIHVKEGLLESLERSGCLEAIGRDRIFQSKTAAVAAIFETLDRSICRNCVHRIFRECGNVDEA